MGTVRAGELKRGMVVIVDTTPFVIEDIRMAGTAQTKRKIHFRLRDILKGVHSERTYTEDDRLEVADMEQRTVSFSYKDRDRFVFLDSETFDEVYLSSAQVGDRVYFLKENEEYKALFLDGKFIDILLPDNVVMKVESTAAPTRGSSDNTWKPAKLEGGLEIMVPLFIAPGDLIRVDVQNKKYLRKEAAD